ncbi:MAG: hypothetical protein ACT4PL_13540, partial [Phycisphaerales bacterium]
MSTRTQRTSISTVGTLLGLAGLALSVWGAGCSPSGTVNTESASGVGAPSTPPPSTPPAALAYGAATRTVAIIDGKEVEPPDVPMGDPAVLAAIVKEGRDRSKVMEHMTYIATEIGPRLTGSSAAKRANDWAMGQYTRWGLSNARLEQWGTVGVGFDRGPSSGKVFMPDAPRPRAGATSDSREWRSVRELQFTTLSWTSGTKGPVRGPVQWMPKTEEEYQEAKSKLKGAWVLVEPPPPVGGRGIRDRAATGFDQRRDAREKVAAGTDPATLPIPQRVMFDGIAGYISTSRDERVWTGSVGGWRNLTMETVAPEVHIVVRLSDYDYINSRLADNEDFQVEFDLKHTFNPGPVAVY